MANDHVGERELERQRLVIETRLKRAELAVARRECALAEAKLATERNASSTQGWNALLTPTGVVIVGAALGLVGTALGKWADYKANRQAQETTIILKASEVSQSLSPEAQDRQRARNVLWFAEANYIELPAQFTDDLRKIAGVPKGQVPPPPVVGAQETAAGVGLVAAFEGFSPKVYKSGNDSFIGYSHRLTPQETSTGAVLAGGVAVSYSDGISEPTGRALLEEDMKPSYAAVDRLVKVPLTAAQRGALASFVFNVGARNFERSTLLKQLNEGDTSQIAVQLGRWSSQQGHAIAALQQRRASEAALFLQGASAASQ